MAALYHSTALPLYRSSATRYLSTLLLTPPPPRPSPLLPAPSEYLLYASYTVFKNNKLFTSEASCEASKTNTKAKAKAKGAAESEL